MNITNELRILNSIPILGISDSSVFSNDSSTLPTIKAIKNYVESYIDGYEYTLPVSTDSTLGGVKIGSGLSISNELINLGGKLSYDTSINIFNGSTKHSFSIKDGTTSIFTIDACKNTIINSPYLKINPIDSSTVYILDSSAILSSTSKLLSLKTGGIERTYFDYAGNLHISTVYASNKYYFNSNALEIKAKVNEETLNNEILFNDESITSAVSLYQISAHSLPYGKLTPYYGETQWDCNEGLNKKMTLSTNTTLVLQNVQNGMSGDLVITVTDVVTITLPSGYLNGNVTDLSIGRYHLCFTYDGANLDFNIAKYV